jgi:hypothetical protein
VLGPHRVVLFVFLPDDGSKSSFRNVVFQTDETMANVQSSNKTYQFSFTLQIRLTFYSVEGCFDDALQTV